MLDSKLLKRLSLGLVGLGPAICHMYLHVYDPGCVSRGLWDLSHGDASMKTEVKSGNIQNFIYKNPKVYKSSHV